MGSEGLECEGESGFGEVADPEVATDGAVLYYYVKVWLH